MAPAPLAALARRLTPPADADLLARYSRERDDGAFAELVRRHGPAVLAVCRRLTGHAHDAEDAFQAVFVVLARKADRLGPGVPLGSWLFGAAVRTARKAAARAWRRGAHETLAADVPDVPDRPTEPFDPDAVRAVLEEVGRLSAAYRAAVVLCELEGRSRAAAARELGIAEGTLSSRLAAARRHLARRLTARGFGPAALVALAPVVVPRRLAAAALLASTDRVPPAVRTLARGALPIMDVSRLSIAPVLAALAAAAALAAPQPESPSPPVPMPRAVVPRPVAPRAAAPVAGPNKLFFCQGDHFYLCDPDGRNSRVVTHPDCRDPHPTSCALSPDGKTVAYARNTDDRHRREFKLLVFAADGTGPATDLGDGRAILDFLWAGDGTRLAVTTADPKAEALATAELRHEAVDVATGRRTRLPIPAGHHLTDWSRDGKRFLTAQFTYGPNGPEAVRTWILDRHGKTVREIVAPAKMEAGGGRFSPDGRRVLYDVHRPGAAGLPDTLMVLDLVTGTSTPVAGIPPGGHLAGCCWSPDGRRVAYTWQSNRVESKPGHLDPNQKIELRAIVCDPDGRNATEIASNRSTAANWSFGTIDWR
ncbi:sigma-70 family RNA polymerase sigma factor [bacterium]|nr:sigma-70 family RNA polymerase sigma factor [bacterium]